MENNDRFLVGFISGICITLAGVLLISEGIVDVKVQTKGDKAAQPEKGKRAPGDPSQGKD